MAVKALCRWGKKKKVILAKNPTNPNRSLHKLTHLKITMSWMSHELNHKFLCSRSIEMNFLWTYGSLYKKLRCGICFGNCHIQDTAPRDASCSAASTEGFTSIHAGRMGADVTLDGGVVHGAGRLQAFLRERLLQGYIWCLISDNLPLCWWLKWSNVHLEKK